MTRWEGEPQPLEDQDIRWQRAAAPDVAPMLPANAPVLAALALPAVMIVSDAAAQGIDPWIERLTALVTGEQVLVQIREKSMEHLRVQHLVSRALTRAEPFGSRVVVNSASGSYPQATGIHLTSRDLMAASARPAAPLAGASCHDAAQLDQAAALGLDYAVLGPVKKTASHPQAAPLGWERFAELARGRPMPVYAIGGLTRADLAEARRHGAHGVALLSAAFE